MANPSYNEASKKRLLNNITRKFDTTIIGSLAILEEEFGDLWGHGLEYNELTEEQKEFRVTWQSARTRLLDAGNSNLRAALSEIAQYTLSWNRFVMNFKSTTKDN
jgi:hypothetical protein